MQIFNSEKTASFFKSGLQRWNNTYGQPTDEYSKQLTQFTSSVQMMLLLQVSLVDNTT